MKIEILPKISEISILKKYKGNIAIIACLYYEQCADKLIKKLSVLGDCFNIYIVSSKKAILEKMKAIYGESFIYVLKYNRGRDLSALLVTMKSYVKQYEFVCFLHDKQEKGDIRNDVFLFVNMDADSFLWEPFPVPERMKRLPCFSGISTAYLQRPVRFLL